VEAELVQRCTAHARKLIEEIMIEFMFGMVLNQKKQVLYIEYLLCRTKYNLYAL
jgi:hypothetical protein